MLYCISLSCSLTLFLKIKCSCKKLNAKTRLSSMWWCLMSPTTSLIYPWYVTCRSFAFSGKNTVEISNQLSIHLLFATYPVSFGQQLKQRYPDPPPALLDGHWSVPKPESDNLSRLSMACPQWQSCSPQGSLRLSPATLPTARDHSWGWERRSTSWQLCFHA